MTPELQSVRGPETPESLLAEILRRTRENGGCTGLTVSGGEPFRQAEALERLLEAVRQDFSDILVYTGYTLSEILDGQCGKAGKRCLSYIDVLIDGPYLEARNSPDCALRGSDNQTIHYLTPGLKPVYESYLAGGRMLESFSHNGNVIITGISDRREQR